MGLGQGDPTCRGVPQPPEPLAARGLPPPLPPAQHPVWRRAEGSPLEDSGLGGRSACCGRDAAGGQARGGGRMGDGQALVYPARPVFSTPPRLQHTRARPGPAAAWGAHVPGGGGLSPQPLPLRRLARGTPSLSPPLPWRVSLDPCSRRRRRPGRVQGVEPARDRA